MNTLTQTSHTLHCTRPALIPYGPISSPHTHQVKVAREMAKLHRYDDGEEDTPTMWPQLWSWLRQAQSSVGSLEAKWGTDVARRFGQIHAELFAENLHDIGENRTRVLCYVHGCYVHGCVVHGFYSLYGVRHMNPTWARATQCVLSVC